MSVPDKMVKHLFEVAVVLNNIVEVIPHSSLKIGCWNVQYFKTALLYFELLINHFDILPISEHCLFEEQLGLLKTATDSSYNYHAVSANDNPPILSSERVHGNVALIWNDAIDNFDTPLDTIDSDRIVQATTHLKNLKNALITFGLCMTPCQLTVL